MKEPTRWLEDPQTAEPLRKLLGVAPDAPAMPARAHAHLATFALGLTAKAAAQATFGSAALRSLGSFFGIHGTGKALLLASAMGTLGVGSYVGVRHYVTRASSVQSAGSPMALSSPQPTLLQPVASSPSIEELPTLAAAAAHAEPESAPSSGTAPRAAASQNSSGANARASAGQGGAGAFEELNIADEARLLERARAAVATQPGLALEIANTHQRLYPAGQLSAERELIAVDALLRLGRRSDAEQRAEPSLRASPNGLYARRLRKLLD